MKTKTKTLGFGCEASLSITHHQVWIPADAEAPVDVYEVMYRPALLGTYGKQCLSAAPAGATPVATLPRWKWALVESTVTDVLNRANAAEGLPKSAFKSGQSNCVQRIHGQEMLPLLAALNGAQTADEVQLVALNWGRMSASDRWILYGLLTMGKAAAGTGWERAIYIGLAGSYN